MSHKYNDIAILITQKIVLDLQRFKQVSTDQQDPSCAPNRYYISGSFYQIRESILQSVSDLVRVFEIDHASSPEQMRLMRNEIVDEYRKHKEIEIIGQIAKAIHDSKAFSVETFEPDQCCGWMRRDTYSVGLIDLGKVSEVLNGK